jgi:protein-disulfide isomerase
MLGDGADSDTAKKVYELRYAAGAENHAFDLGPSVPHSGPVDAPVQLVEFFDYNCHVCRDTLPILEEALKAHPGQVVLYYKQFPLGRWPDSPAAAQAALAAGKQGKYVEMHTLLFANQGHGFTEEDLDGFAKKLGLDMRQFAADYAAAADQVEADHAEGKSSGVTSTPTIFVGGRPNHAPHDRRYLDAWIEEELAASR